MSSESQYSAQHFIRSDRELAPPALPRKILEVTSANKNINSLATFCEGEHVFAFSIPQGYVFKPKQSTFRGKFRIRVKSGLGGFRQQKTAHHRLTTSVLTVEEEGGGSGGGDAELVSRVKQKLEIEYDTNGEPEGDNQRVYSLALAYNAFSTLFQDFRVSLAGNYMTQTTNVAQVDTMCKRLWGNKELNDSWNAYLNPSWYQRHKRISAPLDFDDVKEPAYETESLVNFPWHSEFEDSLPGSDQFDLWWRPHFGVLNSESLPTGEYRIEFKANTMDQIKQSFVQSLQPEGELTLNDYEVEIVDFRYYYVQELAQEGSIKNDKLVFDYGDILVQAKDVSTMEDSNIGWDLHKGTHAAAIAFQSEKSWVGKHPFYSKTLLTVPLQRAGIPVNAIKLNDFYFECQGVTYPTRPHRGMGTQNAQHLSQIHMQNLIEQGNYLIEQPGESLGAFYELGPYLFFQLDLNMGNERRLQSNQSFTKHVILDEDGQDTVPAWDQLKVRALLFSFKRRLAEVKYNSNGLVSSVLVSDK